MIFHRLLEEDDSTAPEFMGMPVLLINYAERWWIAESPKEDEDK